MKRFGIAFGAAAAFCGGIYLSARHASATVPGANHHHGQDGSGVDDAKAMLKSAAGIQARMADPLSDAGRHETFSAIANRYDGLIEKEEARHGIDHLRLRALDFVLKEHPTRILETACGTGRNVDLASQRIREDGLDGQQSLMYVMVDVSPQMVVEAAKKRKWAMTTSTTEAEAEADTVRVQPAIESVAQVADASALPYADCSFDVVFDTFGLCSVDDPDRVISESARVVRPGGSLVFLEHGSVPSSSVSASLPSSSDGDGEILSRFERIARPIVNAYLDITAANHAKSWGCWYNRDILKAVQDVARRDDRLAIEHVETHHYGTSILIVLRKEGDRPHNTRSSSAPAPAPAPAPSSS
eukprot:ANDGO_07823.mRNA.1 mitochondrial Methyltransferase OMS1